MDISLIICTRNRAVFLAEHLNALSHLRTEGITAEIIFVNNGSSDEAESVLRGFNPSFEVSVAVVSEPVRGLARARNRGLCEARGEFIVFTDDDCYPDPQLLIETTRVYKNTGWDFLGGRVTLFDPDDAPITIKLDAEPSEIIPGQHVEAGVLHGANLSFRRETLSAIGGFDERLGAGTSLVSGEDYDVIVRASAAGFRGGYSPVPTVAHHHRRRQNDELKTLMKGYDIGRGAVYAKMIMHRKTRILYLRHWYWRFHMFFRTREWRSMSRELLGAFRYVAKI